MAAIFIESDDAKNLKLLTDLAKQLGIKVSKLSVPEVEDIHLGMLIKREKTGKTVSRDSIMKLLDAE